MEVVKDPDNSRGQVLIQMVNQYQGILLRMCYVYLRDIEQAKDATQETFLKAYKSLTAFRGDCSEKSWLIQIAINTWNVICQGQIYPLLFWKSCCL